MVTCPVKITLFQIAGVLYYSNKLAVQKFLRVPGCGSVLLEPVFSDSEPTAEAPLGMGATLDIQRQQRMDMLTSNCSCLSWHTSGEMHSNNRLRYFYNTFVLNYLG